MKETIQTEITAYIAHLKKEERSPATQQQYQRELQRFIQDLGERPLDKNAVIAYKAALQQAYQPSSVNTKLAAINGFLVHSGRPEMKVKALKIQKPAYCAKEKELSKKEYLQMVKTARQQKNEQLALVLQTLCGTGIRVSELRFITVEAVEKGEAAIVLKGKNRKVLLPRKLCRLLKRYIREKGLKSGPVFVSKKGNPLDRSNLWKGMKRLCQEAQVNGAKAFPHNLRHLFARCFYAAHKDLGKLADLLGHSNINTTRIYILSSGQEHRKQVDALGLIL